MGAPVRLRHDGHDGDTGSGADGFGAEAGEEGVPLRVGHGGDHLHQLGGAGEAVLAAGGGFEGVEVDVLAGAAAVDHGRDDLGDGADAGLLLSEGVGEDAAAAGVRPPPAAGRRCRVEGVVGGGHRGLRLVSAGPRWATVVKRLNVLGESGLQFWPRPTKGVWNGLPLFINRWWGFE